MSEFGYEEGATCNREGCGGEIELEKVENCSCHISHPCSQHMDQDTWCPECGWRAKDDPLCVQDMGAIYLGSSGFAYVEPKKRVLDPTKIDWVPELHTAASMIKKGVFPIGTPRDEVEKAVRGTFGGRFEYFNAEKGQFKYVAYTD